MSACRWCLVLGLCAAPLAWSQQIRTYTQTPQGSNSLVYGLPVPAPIDSLTPIDGFRSYAAIEARLQGLALTSPDLAAHDVGRSIHGRTIWAYVVSDDDGVDVEGRPEAAFFIRANTHAREWGTPEVSTGTIERMLDGAADAGLVRYLLDNTRLVIIPVHNVDGLLQTQRFPTDVIVGADPNVPNVWPRDGRMRRKNMRGVDEILTTFGDHLQGIDLNRNSPPFHATSSGSSNDPRSLTFHGASPHSEPESQAMVEAARLGPETRFRLGIDVHTFSQVFFSSNTARTRLNEIQRRLLSKLSSHHFVLSGKLYQDITDPPNVGIGTAAEYFAYQWLVPAWTLELEPVNSAAEYGGTTVTHGGFILPAAEVRRVRESWAESHLIAFYEMAGPPHLARVRIRELGSDALVFESHWQFNPGSARRVRNVSLPGVLRPGTRYRAELAFSKPMRRRDAAGVAGVPPGLPRVGIEPVIQLQRGGTGTALAIESATWVDDPARVLRYRDDTFRFEFVAPEEVGDFGLVVAAKDMTGHALDADPTTPADWDAGAWFQYEDGQGVSGDVGGPDARTTLRVAAAALDQITLVDGPRLLGEGDSVGLALERTTPDARRVLVRWVPGAGAAPVEVSWDPGSGGRRELPVYAADDLVAAGDRTLEVRLDELHDGVVVASDSVAYQLLDNDRADALVMRARSAAGLTPERWELLRRGAARRALVLDRDAAYELPVVRDDGSGEGLGAVESELVVYANGATLETGIAQRQGSVIQVDVAGRLTLDRAHLVLGGRSSTPQAGVINNRGRLRLERLRVNALSGFGDEIVSSDGDLALWRTAIDAGRAGNHDVLRIGAGTARVDASAVFHASASNGSIIALSESAALDLAATSIIDNQVGLYTILGADPAAPDRAGHVLLQQNQTEGLISPPIGAECPDPLQSLGFNIEPRNRCGFTTSSDRNGLSLGPFELDPALGGPAPRGLAIDGGAPAADAAATGCGRVDLRGAPRPQTQTAGSEPRCDVGAIELGVNPYRGIWSPQRSGHGIDLQTAGNSLFLAWYTYDDGGEPTAYQAAAPLTGAHWQADLRQSRRDPVSGQVTVVDVGEVTIDFDSDTEARLGWRFDLRGVNGSERIRAAQFASGEPRFEVTGLWYPPADSGHGATISRRGEVTAIGVYYYDAEGRVRWALGTGSAADALQLEMTSFRGFCPDCDAASNPVTGRPAGSLRVHFLTPARARVELDLVHPGNGGGAWVRPAAEFVPLNDLVDNALSLPDVRR